MLHTHQLVIPFPRTLKTYIHYIHYIYYIYCIFPPILHSISSYKLKRIDQLNPVCILDIIF